MCVYGFYIKPKQNTDLIVIGNRDEELSRKFKPLQLNRHKGIFRPLDLKERGSWIGAGIDGKIVFLTNYRDPSKINNNAPSRGLIVKKFLQSRDLKTFKKWLLANAYKFNGFNIVFGIKSRLFYFSNILYQIKPLQKGLYSLSNAFLNSNWPKCIKIKSILSDYTKGKMTEKELIEKLKDRTKTTHNLPDTGIGFEKEVFLSSLFIDSPFYGTTASYIITIKSDGATKICEMIHSLNRFSCFRVSKNKILRGILQIGH